MSRANPRQDRFKNRNKTKNRPTWEKMWKFRHEPHLIHGSICGRCDQLKSYHTGKCKNRTRFSEWGKDMIKRYGKDIPKKLRNSNKYFCFDGEKICI